MKIIMWYRFVMYFDHSIRTLANNEKDLEGDKGDNIKKPMRYFMLNFCLEYRREVGIPPKATIPAERPPDFHGPRI